MRTTRPSTIAPRRGFSFVEVLFAVLILGVGLILVAAVFPVGIAQTQENEQETQSAAQVGAAVATLSNAADNELMPGTAAPLLSPAPRPAGADGIVPGLVLSFHDP